MLPQNKNQLTEKRPPRTMDMCHGPLMQQIVLFSLPLFMSWLLQFTFNAADTIIVGKFASSQAMAAVGSTIVVISLFSNVLLGLSSGTAVLTSQYFGAKKPGKVNLVLHTSILVAIIGGVLFAALGLALSRPILNLMAVPDNLKSQSTTYMCVCCAGLPFQMLYSYGSAVMRSLGDTKRPMFFLVFAGIVNVILNLLFVIAFGMDVTGVALATVISHAISAFLVCLALARNDEPYRLHLRKLKLDMEEFRKQLRIGVPSGLQGSFFTLSNMVIQSSINSLGDIVMAGNAAVESMENIVYLASYCAFHVSLTFVGQNYGGKQYRRIKKSMLYTSILGVLISETTGFAFLYFGNGLMSFFTSSPEVVSIGIQRMLILYTLYGLCALMDVASGALRGLGYALFPSVSIFLSVCVFRVLWSCTVFSHFHTLSSLLYSYPISWGVAAGVNFLYLWYIMKSRIKPQLRQSLQRPATLKN